KKHKNTKKTVPCDVCASCGYLIILGISSKKGDTAMKRVSAMLIVLFVALSLAAGQVMAQTATGQITGTVRDANGAVLAKAKVRVDNASTGLARETTTTDEGGYVFPLLPVGVYAVTVEQQGFRSTKKSNISINVDQIVRADFELTVGDVSAV